MISVLVSSSYVDVLNMIVMLFYVNVCLNVLCVKVKLVDVKCCSECSVCLVEFMVVCLVWLIWWMFLLSWGVVLLLFGGGEFVLLLVVVWV